MVSEKKKESLSTKELLAILGVIVGIFIVACCIFFWLDVMGATSSPTADFIAQNFFEFFLAFIVVLELSFLIYSFLIERDGGLLDYVIGLKFLSGFTSLVIFFVVIPVFLFIKTFWLEIITAGGAIFGIVFGVATYFAINMSLVYFIENLKKNHFKKPKEKPQVKRPRNYKKRKVGRPKAKRKAGRPKKKK
jgi:uncharacterized membrane protein